MRRPDPPCGWVGPDAAVQSVLKPAVSSVTRRAHASVLDRDWRVVGGPRDRASHRWTPPSISSKEEHDVHTEKTPFRQDQVGAAQPPSVDRRSSDRPAGRSRPLGQRAGERRQLRLPGRHPLPAAAGARRAQRELVQLEHRPRADHDHDRTARNLRGGPGQIWLDPNLLDSGEFSWGTVQHEYAHEVDFELLNPAIEAQLETALGGTAWCYADNPSLQHNQYGCERFASTLAWAYWQSPENSMQPSMVNGESGGMQPAAFRALMTSILGAASSAKPLAPASASLRKTRSK